MAGRHQASGRFTKKDFRPKLINFRKTCISDPPINTDTESETPTSSSHINLDHCYDLSKDSNVHSPHSLFNEIEVTTTQDECCMYDDLMFTYLPSDLVPLDHCRFIVDLGYLAEQMKTCQSCQSALHLCNALGVRPLGLAGIMYVQCAGCGSLARIKLGKTHHRGDSKKGIGTFDINTKAATGMLHAGIGETQLNNLLFTMNLHSIDGKTLKMRETEVGMILEKKVQESEEKFLLEEAIESLNITTENEEISGISASTDTCWQKKGSGRAYNSMSGFWAMPCNLPMSQLIYHPIGSMIKGVCGSVNIDREKTGKVLHHAIRCQQCRICDIASKRKIQPRKHNCKRNWTGSAKAMEPDMLVQMVMDVKKKGVEIGEIAGDDDTTGYEILRRIYPNSNIRKTSDRNHVKKNVIKKLYSIKNQHKELSEMVINSILKNFSFLLEQNKGNVEGMENSLKAMVEHMYGEHNHCSSSWCGFLKDKDNYKHHNLPHGKNLTSSSLRVELEKIFLGKEADPRKMSNLSSSQANESLNNMIASKAPKAKHYSSSASLGYRVDSTILQKNEGYSYVCEVHESMGLSPGQETIKRTSRINKKRQRSKKKAKTKEAKRRRFILKQTRTSKNASKEVREGKTYESEIGLSIEGRLDEDIPGVDDNTLISVQNITKAPLVVFDLETTGLSRKSDITQIAAHSKSSSFNTYVFPSQTISKEASEVTNIFVNNNRMFHNNREVQYVLPHKALTDFIQYLESFHAECILVGHNIKRFDCHILYNQLKYHNMWNEFCVHVCGFLDTLDLFKKVVPGLLSYSQTSLVKELLGESYDAHNAIYDTELLYKLVVEKGAFYDHWVELLLPVSYPYDTHVNQDNLNTFSAAMNCKAISKSCALKAFKSGLRLSHLKLAVHRDGIDGLKALLSEKNSSGKVRVTSHGKVIQKLFDFLYED